MRILWKHLPFAALFGACVSAGWLLRGNPEGAAGREETGPRRTRAAVRPGISPTGSGTAIVDGWIGKLAATGDADLHQAALGLMASPHRIDLSLWAPLLARWSAADGAGMIAFADAVKNQELRERLLKMAWYAWAAADPEAAIAAGKSLPPGLAKELLDGVAEVDVAKAVALALAMPNSQFAFGGIAGRVVKSNPELMKSLMDRAVYDGGRIPFQNAKVAELAASDPAAAIAFARSCGVIGSDPVPRAVEAIAKLDPEAAREQVEAMESSRSKALSAVALAEIWTEQDPASALKWVRGNLAGPVLQSALLAAASGSGDPASGLKLVAEAGWEVTGDFHSIRDNGTMNPSESRTVRTPADVAAELLRQWAGSDPAAARSYMETKVPAGLREKISKSAGMQQ